MKPKDFEQSVLDLALTTRVPLSRANILFYTGAGSKQADKWLDGMVGDGLLDLDADDEGEVIYTVRGATRPASGATELARCASCGRATAAGMRCTRCGQSTDARLRALRGEVDRAAGALTLLRRGNELLRPQGPQDKSLLVAGLLGLFAGPFGWLYAAPMREAAPVVGVMLLMMMVIPHFILLPMMALLLPILMPTSALVGALYAWKYNRAGHRSGLLSDDESGAPPRG